MQKAYKISLITYFIVTISCVSATEAGVYSPPELALILKSDTENTVGSLSSTFADYSHTAYKITQSTRKINTTLVRKGADLLVHFTKPNNQVIVQVSDVRGKLVSSTSQTNMDSGFYEIPVLPSDDESSLYFVSLIVNQRAYSFQVSFQP